MHTEDETAIAMIKLGYATDDPTDRHRNLGFTVRFDSLEGAQEACRVIDQYNDFSGEKVAAALGEIASLGGALGPPGFSIGRESSPCIYINQLDTREDKDFGAQVEKIRAILHAAGADEVDTVQDGAGSSYGGTVRAWWD